jgi:hypothetical protein
MATEHSPHKKHRYARQYFASCGFSVEGEQIQRLTGGLFHRVYKITHTDGSESVRKISRLAPSLIHRQNEQVNIRWLQKYFGDFLNMPSVHTERPSRRFRVRPVRQIIESPFLSGRPIQNSDILNANGTLSPIGEELSQIIVQNETMQRQTGLVFDMLGLTEAVGLLISPRRRKNMALGNIFVVNGNDGQQHLKMIDTDLANTRKNMVFPKKILISSLINVQNLILQKHFALAYQKAHNNLYANATV